jgi:hypothetical protein
MCTNVHVAVFVMKCGGEDRDLMQTAQPSVVQVRGAQFPWCQVSRATRFCTLAPKICGWAVPWLRRLVAGLSPRRFGFDPGSVHVGFVVDKVALGQVFSPCTSVSPCQYHSTGTSLLVKTKKKTNHLHHRVAQ